MKKRFFTLLMITITIQGYSQTSQQYFHDLRNYFSTLHMESDQISNRFWDLAEYSSWNSGEHQNMGQGNLANNWNDIRNRFEDLEMHFDFIRNLFMNSEIKFNDIGLLLGDFDGSYSSLSGLPSLFDGSFSSLSGTPTTLAGYGITDAFDGSYASLSGLPSLFDGSFSSLSGTPTTLAGYGITDAFDGSYASLSGLPSLFDGSFSSLSGTPTTLAGYGITDAFDGSYASLSGLPSLFDGSFSSLSGTPTTLAGYGITDAFDGSYASLSGLPSLVVESITEVGNTGIRLSSANANLYGDIGNNAIDLTFSNNDVSSGATGDFSVALGENTTASGNHSTAVGYNSNATGTYSVAIGATNNSSGYASTTLGDSNLASGRASTAIGAGTIAEDFGMLSIGVWSSPLSQPNPDQFSYNNTALLIGNGPDADNRSNALQVLFDGTTTIAGDLNVNSDARLKANIVSLGRTLAKLLQIDGKSYTMKKDESEKQKIGLLAQDIEKVFPELVSESNGIKSVNYQGLVPVLINAMKEQQRILSEQQSELNVLKSMMNKIIERQ